MSSPTVWPCLNYTDALRAIRFLVDAVGFEERAVHADPDGHVHHAELLWSDGGGIMLGSAKADGTLFEQRPTGGAGLYLVTDDPDALYRRVKDAGGNIVMGLRDREEHDGREFTVSDPEGNLWTFGTYRGE